MDPITVSRLARIRQQEILDQAARDQFAESATVELLRTLGRSLKAAGQKLVNAARLARAPRTAPWAMAPERRQRKHLESEPCVEC
jgi:hypothetical protein